MTSIEAVSRTEKAIENKTTSLWLIFTALCAQTILLWCNRNFQQIEYKL